MKLTAWLYDLRRLVIAAVVIFVVGSAAAYYKAQDAAAYAADSAAATRAQTEQLLEIARDNRANGERVRDCTDPAGACFKAGQQRTGQAVASINDAVVAAIACAQEPPAVPPAKVAERNETIRRCVEAVLTDKSR